MFKKILRPNVFVVQLLSFGPVEEGKYMKLKNKVATVKDGGIPIVKGYEILFSGDMGNGITSYKHFGYYLGLYHTF